MKKFVWAFLLLYAFFYLDLVVDTTIQMLKLEVNGIVTLSICI